MNLRINVSYPATDGSMPESVEVEWLDVSPADADPGPALGRVLDQLLTAPARRNNPAPPPWPMPTVDDATPELHRLLALGQCRRQLCGHSAAHHSLNGAGPCEICGSVDQCRSFVGANSEETES